MDLKVNFDGSEIGSQCFDVKEFSLKIRLQRSLKTFIIFFFFGIGSSVNFYASLAFCSRANFFIPFSFLLLSKI